MTSAPVKYRPIGTPDGPQKWVEELGEETPTFLQKPDNPKLNPCLMHHVPLDKRGPFRPSELANFERDREYRTDAMGYLLCYKTITVKGNTKRCGHRAMNRFPRCHIHGGRLHPMDKAERIDPGKVGEAEFVGRTRYQQYRSGMISIHDLDDEEIANGGFRQPNGKFYKPESMPREMLSAFAEQVYERATLALRSGATDAANVIIGIMNDPLQEPKLRLAAAESILDRTLGKAPQTVRLESKATWEVIFDGIATGSREASRQARGVPSERADLDGTVALENSAASSQITISTDDLNTVSFDSDTDADEQQAVDDAPINDFLPFNSAAPDTLVDGVIDAEEVPLDPDWG